MWSVLLVAKIDFDGTGYHHHRVVQLLMLQFSGTILIYIHTHTHIIHVYFCVATMVMQSGHLSTFGTLG